MTATLFWLSFLLPIAGSLGQQQNYYHDQQRQPYQQNYQGQHYQNNYRTPSYSSNYRTPGHQSSYYRTESPQFNISAIKYSNKFQSPASTTTTTTITPSPQRHSYSQVDYHRTVHHRPAQAQNFGTCNVPNDFCYEIAQRCGVVQQCDYFKRLTNPITVTLMFEALCPFCQKFISNHLGSLYDQFRGKIELELVPWGNSRLLNNGQISCNHGQAECDANRLMSCVIDIVKTKQAIPFIVCFERQLSTYPQVEQALHHCSTFVRNDYREIRQCYESEKGRQLQRQAAYRTMNIRAHPIIEVPYIVINNYSPSTDANGLNIVSLTQLLNKWINLQRSGR